jgi:alpha-tubulin suppressor-like RCC1 family protein
MKKLFYFIIISFFYSAINAQCFTSVSCGEGHTAALKSNGTIWTWGWDGWNQMGNSTGLDELSPIVLTTAAGWQKTVCGKYNTFVIKTNGTLWGVGNNTFGALGINSVASSSPTFVQVGTATNWKQIAPSSFFTIALRTDGTLWAWGQNNEYQMGDGSCCANRLSPGQIGTATDWKMAGASGSSTGMAIKNNGTLWGWGNNNSTGLLGPSTLSGRPTPTQLGTATDWATMSLGWLHILALKTNSTLWSWGGGGQGQTGDNLSPAYFRDTPMQIGTSTWLKVAAGFQSSYGIKSDGTLWAWGLNDAGQLGDGTTVNRMQPIQIGTDNDWAEVAGGYQHAVAIKTNGALWAWGSNIYGQLGNGTTTATIVPTAIPVAGCALGVDGFEKEEFVLAPNPAKNMVNIVFTATSSDTALEIYDLTGRLIANYASQEPKGEWNLSLDNFAAGIYVVVLKEQGQIILQKKLIKE